MFSAILQYICIRTHPYYFQRQIIELKIQFMHWKNLHHILNQHVNYENILRVEEISCKNVYKNHDEHNV